MLKYANNFLLLFLYYFCFLCFNFFHRALLFPHVLADTQVIVVRGTPSSSRSEDLLPIKALRHHGRNYVCRLPETNRQLGLCSQTRRNDSPLLLLPRQAVRLTRLKIDCFMPCIFDALWPSAPLIGPLSLFQRQSAI